MNKDSKYQKIDKNIISIAELHNINNPNSSYTTSLESIMTIINKILINAAYKKINKISIFTSMNIFDNIISKEEANVIDQILYNNTILIQLTNILYRMNYQYEIKPESALYGKSLNISWE